MVLFDRLVKRPMYKSGFQRPWDSESIVQIVGIEPKGDEMAVLDVLYFPEEVSVWQPPDRQKIRTILLGSAGARPAADAVPAGSRRRRPEGDAPVPRGDGPAQGTLDQEALDRARDYLEAGGWTNNSSGL